MKIIYNPETGGDNTFTIEAEVQSVTTKTTKTITGKSFSLEWAIKYLEYQIRIDPDLNQNLGKTK